MTPGTTPDVSVVIPVYNDEATIGECLNALAAQSLATDRFEIVVVDDGSTDASAAVAETSGARVVKQANRGAGAARNTGADAANGRWLAFTDGDCLPTRNWLAELLGAAGADGVVGAAGSTVGIASDTPPARFVDLTGGLDAKRHLSHPTFPFAPTGNVMYATDAFRDAGGFDERYVTYEGADLYSRVMATSGGEVAYAPRAVVLHRHRDTWPAFVRQQLGYGRGYAQFFWHHRDDLAWTPGRELRAWGRIALAGLRAARPGGGDGAIVRRGTFVKDLAQRIGFVTTYWNPRERARW